MATVSPDELERATLFVRGLVDSLDLPDLVTELRTTDTFDHSALVQAVFEVVHPLNSSRPRTGFWMARVAICRARLGRAPEQTARAFFLAGEALNMLRRFGLALLHHSRARDVYRSLGDGANESRCENRRAHSLVHLDLNEESRAASDRAYALGEQLQSPVLMGQALGSRGVMESRLDRYREALLCYRQALEWYVRAERPAVANAPLYSNMARCFEAQHRFGAAKRHFEIARRLLADHGYAHFAAQVEYNMGYFAFLRGHYAEALSLYARAETVFLEVRDDSHIAQVNLDRAELHLQTGMPERARELVLLVLPVMRRARLKKERAQGLFYLAVADLLGGQHEAAERDLVKAQTAFRSLEYGAWVAECDQLRARAALRLGNPQRALRMAKHAEAAFNDAGLSARATAALLLMAQIDLDEGRPDQTIERLRDLEGRLRRLGAPWLELEADRLMALALIDLGEDARGIEHLEAAVAVLESRRGNVPADEFMVAFMASRSAIYGETVDALVAAGRMGEAFAYSERGKSRALVDMLSERIDGAGRTSGRRARSGLLGVRLAQTRDQLNVLYARLHALGGADAAPAPEERERLTEKLAATERAFASLRLTARAQDPQLGSLTAVDAPDLAAVQAGLDDDTTLLEYFMTAEGGHVFAVTRAGITHRHLSVTEDDLERRLRRFRFHLSVFTQADVMNETRLGHQLAATRGNLERLTRALIDPVLDGLDTRRLLIVPHGVLHGLPFHALPLGDDWLCDRFDVAYVPSAAVYAHCTRAREHASGPACVMSVPDQLAPQIADEAIAVSQALGPETVLVADDDVTLERVREAAASSRLLHIASHAMFRADHPMLSGIRLGGGAWLNLYDVYDLEVCAELVILSACETGVARVTQGDEVLGLLRGFIYAGAPRLLISQWRVSDAATALFMQCFYRGCRNGHTYGESLRTAMRAVRAEYPHPYHWAAFYMVGDSEARSRRRAAP